MVEGLNPVCCKQIFIQPKFILKNFKFLNEFLNIKKKIFFNFLFSGRLDDIGIRSVFDYLEQLKHIEWCDKQKTRCNIYWRRPEEWAIQIYEWANSIGLLNSVVTIFELTQGEDVVQEGLKLKKFSLKYF